MMCSWEHSSHTDNYPRFILIFHIPVKHNCLSHVCTLTLHMDEKCADSKEQHYTPPHEKLLVKLLKENY